MAGQRTFGIPGEWIAALIGVILASGIVLAVADVDTKYKLAAILAIGGFAFLVAFPQRRIACVVLWVLIHPLSIEKVFFVHAPEGPQFSNPTIVINMADAPLFLLAIFLLAETLSTNRLAFHWSRLTTVLTVLLAWSLMSYAIHATFLRDGFLTSAPLTLLQDVRLIVFALLIQSAIRSRGDVIVVLLAVALAVLIQVAIVGVSYSTGRLINYAATTTGAGTGNATLQGFDTSGGGEMLRATGTVGQVNEQAIFHVIMTFPIIAFFAARSGLVRVASLGLVAASALAIVLTFSRGAWLGFPFGVAVCIAIAARRRMLGRTAIIAGALLALASGVALAFLAEPIYQRVVYGDTGATAARVRLIELAADLFKAYPLIGVGPGEFDEAALQLYPPGFAPNQWAEPGEKVESTTIGRIDYSEMRLGELFPYRRPLPVHNKYMLMLSELGLPGLLIWLWLYAEIIRAAWRCSKLPDTVLSVFGLAELGAAAAQMAYMMVEHFHDDKPLALVLFGPAVVFGALRVARPAGAPAARPLLPGSVRSPAAPRGARIGAAPG